MAERSIEDNCSFILICQIFIVFEQGDSSDIDEHTGIYVLSSVVSNIQDIHEGNTLVAAIHVSETYHERKEVLIYRGNSINGHL